MQTDVETARPSRIAAARERPMVMARLSPAERLEAQRQELELAFAEAGAHRPRLVDSVAYGYLPENIVIGVELQAAAPEWPLFATLGAKAMAIAGINAYFVRVVAS